MPTNQREPLADVVMRLDRLREKFPGEWVSIPDEQSIASSPEPGYPEIVSGEDGTPYGINPEEAELVVETHNALPMLIDAAKRSMETNSPIEDVAAGLATIPRSSALVAEAVRSAGVDDLRTFELAVATRPKFLVDIVSIATLRALLGNEVEPIEHLKVEESVNLSPGLNSLVVRRRPDLDPAKWWVAGQFETFQQWVNKASGWLGDGWTCVDSKGRRCLRGSHMERARDEDAFPVSFYAPVAPESD